MARINTAWFVVLGALAVVAAVGAVTVLNPAHAGPGCTSGANTSANISNSAGADMDKTMTVSDSGSKPACQYAKSASGDACCTKQGSKASAAMGDCKSGCPITSAYMDFSSINAELVKAVDSGASESEIRNLAVKAGGAYARMARSAVEMYRSQGTGLHLASTTKTTFADWVSRTPMGFACEKGCVKGASMQNASAKTESKSCSVSAHSKGAANVASTIPN